MESWKNVFVSSVKKLESKFSLVFSPVMSSNLLAILPCVVVNHLYKEFTAKFQQEQVHLAMTFGQEAKMYKKDAGQGFICFAMECAVF